MDLGLPAVSALSADPGFGSDAEDIKLFLELLGDGGDMDNLLSSGADLDARMLHCQNGDPQLKEEPQQGQEPLFKSEGSSPSSLGSGELHAEGEQGSMGRRPSEDSQQSAYTQLALLQQQLSALQDTVQQQMQSLRQQPGATPAIQDIQQTLAHMQGLLSTSQRQQQQAQSPLLHTHVQPCAPAHALQQQQQQQQLSDHAAADSHASHASTVGQRSPRPQAPAQSVQQQQQQQQPQRQQGGAGTRAAARPRHKVHRNHVAELTKQLAAMQAEADGLMQQNADLKRRQRVLGMVIQVREAQMHRLNDAKTKPLEVEAEYDNFQKASKNAFVAAHSVERIRSMDAASVAQFYRSFIQELSAVVGQLSQGPDAAVVLGGDGNGDGTCAVGGQSQTLYVQLEGLVNDMRRICKYLQVIQPNFKAMMYENGGIEPPPGLWTQVLAAAGLREEQKREYLVLRDIYCNVARQVYGERRHIASQLQQSLSAQLSARRGADVLGGMTAAREGTVAAMERLHRNVLKERCLMLLTSETFFSSLEVPQLARLCLACYPHKPDEVAIWNEIARQMEERKAGV